MAMRILPIYRPLMTIALAITMATPAMLGSGWGSQPRRLAPE